MKPIPISEAANIADLYGYDQVIIYARRHTGPRSGEHMTAYGKTKKDCEVVTRIGDVLKNFMGWNTKKGTRHEY
jgi:hypothetical protein